MTHVYTCDTVLKNAYYTHYDRSCPLKSLSDHICIHASVDNSKSSEERRRNKFVRRRCYK